MARLPTYQFQLRPIGHRILKVAGAMARYQFRLPRGLVPFLVSFCWQMSVDGGPWQTIRIHPKTGQVRT